MKECNQCGKCCKNYSNGGLSASKSEIEYWDVFRPDISRYVSKGNIWISPDTGEQLELCPWLTKLPDQNKYICDIYHDRPDDCKFYPVTIEQMDIIGIKTTALEAVCNQKNIQNTETGWGKFFTETGLFKVKFLTSDDPVLRDMNIRLTLDYPEDFKLFEQILINLKEPFNLKDIVNFLHRRKDIQDLNKEVKEIYWKNFEKKSTKIKMK